eukprot:9735433-Lingulodinium_polyedra.AAC.1
MAGPAATNPGSRPPTRPLDLISLVPGPGAGAGNPSGAAAASGARSAATQAPLGTAPGPPPW